MPSKADKIKSDVRDFIAKMDEEAKNENLPSWMHLMAKQDPAIADIMARMIKAENNKRSLPGRDHLARR